MLLANKHGLLYYVIVSHVINTVMTALLECYEFIVFASDHIQHVFRIQD